MAIHDGLRNLPLRYAGRTPVKAMALSLSLTVGCAGLRTMDRVDVVFEVMNVAVTAGDAATTYGIVDMCKELNPIIGRCGGGVPIPVYFAFYALLHLALTLTLPQGRTRTGFQAITLGVEGHQTFRNLMILR